MARPCRSALYGVVIFIGLVSLKYAVTEAWSDIAVLLKLRHDEPPKLVEVVRQYMGFEKDTLERIISARFAALNARESGDVAKVGAPESLPRQGLGNFFALAEQYPDRKADEHFRYPRERISGLENRIAERREFYNESVNLNIVYIGQFPEVLLAKLFSLKPHAVLEFSLAETRDVNLRPLFS